MRIVCLQTILKRYHAFFVIYEKGAKFELSLLQIIGGALWVNNRTVNDCARSTGQET